MKLSFLRLCTKITTAKPAVLPLEQGFSEALALQIR